MISEQLKNVLTNTSSSVITPQLSRKTILLKRKNKKICNNTLNSLPQKQLLNDQSQQKTESVSIKSNVPSQIPYADIFEGIEIPPTDPIWLEIIPQDLLLESTVERLLEDNKEYLYNLLGLYLQERVMGDLNMSRFVLPQKFQTQYSKDFTLKSMDRNIGIDSRIYEDFKQCSSQNNNITTYKQYYQQPAQSTTQNFKPQYEPKILSLAGLTTYKANHINFRQPEKPEIMKAPTNQTLGHLQLNGSSNYNQDFKWHNNCERLPNFKNSYSKLNPISNSDIFFTKQRLSYDYYPLSPQSKPNPVQQIPSFKGQFTTTFKNDYQQFDPELLTPKMRNWRQSMANKINSFRERQQ